MSAGEKVFEGWAILELMGHRRLAGYVTEVELAGHGFFRIDIPGFLHTDPSGEQEERGAATQFYSPGAVYALTPTTEDIARAARRFPAPVSVWELERGVAAGRTIDEEEYEQDLLDDDNDPIVDEIEEYVDSITADPRDDPRDGTGLPF